MAERRDFVVYRGDDEPIEFVMVDNGSVAGWQTRFTARSNVASPDPPDVQADGAILDAGSDTTPGKFVVVLTQAQLLALKTQPYAFSFKRIDSGNSRSLTVGTMTVRPDVQHAL